MYQRDDGAQGDQCPDDGQGVTAHQIQQLVGCHGDGDGEVAVLADGGDEEECTGQRGNKKPVKSFILKNTHR